MTDSEQIIEHVDGGKVTFGYSRKSSRRAERYGNEEASVYFQIPVDTKIDPVKYAERQADEKFDKAKIMVWDALGIDWVMNDSGRPEQVEPVVPIPEAQARATVPQHSPSTQPIPQAGIPQRPAPQAPAGGNAMAAVGVYANYPGPCEKCGQNDWWDNRSDVDSRIQQGIKVGPDWKCKNQQCKHGVYRPGTFQYNKTASRSPQTQANAAQAHQVVQQVAQSMPQMQPMYDAAGNWTGPPDEAPF